VFVLSLRYSRPADWDYIHDAAKVCSVPLLGNGDVYDYADYEHAMSAKREEAVQAEEAMEVEEAGGTCPRGDSLISAVMVGRGALIKPWVFQEIKERRRWDISSGERLEILRSYIKYGLEHWGSDEKVCYLYGFTM